MSGSGSPTDADRLASTDHRPLWVVPGAVIVACCAFVGYVGPQPDSPALGVVSGLLTAAMLVAARWGWHQQSTPTDAPMSEYLAAVSAVGFWVVVLLVRSTREFALWAGLLVLPPLGVVPLAVRSLAGDHRTPSLRARVAARRLHGAIGTLLGVLGLLLVISFYFTVVAPVPLAASGLHLHAAVTYGRSLEEPADPRLGFVRGAPRRRRRSAR